MPTVYLVITTIVPFAIDWRIDKSKVGGNLNVDAVMSDIRKGECKDGGLFKSLRVFVKLSNNTFGKIKSIVEHKN